MDPRILDWLTPEECWEWFEMQGIEPAQRIVISRHGEKFWMEENPSEARWSASGNGMRSGCWSLGQPHLKPELLNWAKESPLDKEVRALKTMGYRR
jgi:hypothetical protein